MSAREYNVYYKMPGGREDFIGTGLDIECAKTIARGDATMTGRNPHRYLWISVVQTEGWLLRPDPDPLNGLCGPE